MKKIFLIFLTLGLAFHGFGQPIDPVSVTQETLSLLQNKQLKEARESIQQLEKIPENQLYGSLSDQVAAKTFWLNLYNAAVQLLLNEDPSRFEDRDAFFKKEWITVAGKQLSMDDIEHGIIRGSKNKYTLGYTEKFFVGDFEERFRLAVVDYRIHFALNCGAKSCPPVAIYSVETLNEQLDRSSTLYLKKYVEIDRPNNRVFVPKLCQWFMGDFGGSDGINQMLKYYGFEDDLSNDPTINYLDYDWTLSLNNYIDL